MLEFAVLRSLSQQHQSQWSCKALVKCPEIVLILTVEVICIRKFKILRFVLEQEAVLAPRMLWKGWMLAGALLVGR